MFTKINQFTMSEILEKIIADKRIEVVARKRTVSIDVLQNMEQYKRQCISLVNNLNKKEATGIIAEFKRMSPSKGWINKEADVKEIVAAYNGEGASAISILTDEIYFGGTLDDLRNGRSISHAPILRKDFMIDEYQLIEAKAWGADVILLIAACLTKDEVKQLSAKAKQLGLEVLLEVHNEAELEHICDTVDMIGINNRNLKTFEVNIQTSLNLINKLPTDKPAIAESGISNIDTVITLKQAGFKGFLIGENFMKAANPTIAFAEFVQQLKAKSYAS